MPINKPGFYKPHPSLKDDIFLYKGERENGRFKIYHLDEHQEQSYIKVLENGVYAESARFIENPVKKATELRELSDWIIQESKNLDSAQSLPKSTDEIIVTRTPLDLYDSQGNWSNNY